MEAPSVSGRGVGGRHRRRLALAEDRLELGQLLQRGVRAQVLVAVEAVERRDQVVLEAAVVRRRQVVVRGHGQLVLRLASDLPLEGGQGSVLAHRELGAGLTVLRDRRHDVAGADLGQGREALAVGLRPVDLEQDLAQALAHGDRGVGGGVRPSGDADVDLAERDLVADHDGRLQAGAAGLLDVGRRGLGRELGAEHRLAGQVEVTAVLEHRTGDDLAEALALEPEPGDEPVDGCGEHLLVGGRGVDGVGAGEWDPVAAEDGDATSLGLHVCDLLLWSGCAAPSLPERCENKRGEWHVTLIGRRVTPLVTFVTYPRVHLMGRTVREQPQTRG